MSQRVLSSSQAKANDRIAKDKFGISTLILMENAARAVSQEAQAFLRKHRGAIAVFCGTGNNGGDGFCASRHLLTAGIKPDLYLVGKIDNLTNEARINLEILLKLKQKIVKVNPLNIRLIKQKIKKYVLIVDALLGVGIKGRIRPEYQEIIDLINASGAYVLSVDIPSGLDATSGRALGRCIKADKTVTFVAKKRAMVLAQGKKYCGKIVVKDIGVPL